jgi:predicted negative regulator of RcsB-dependent stress response
MSDRLSRKNMKHDKFVDEVDHLYGSMRKNAQRLTALVIGVLVVLAVIGLFYWFQRNQERKAQDLLSQAIDVMQQQVGTAEQLDPAVPAPKFKTEQEKLAKAEPMFLEVVDKYGRSDAADIANLYLAQIAVEKGDVASARPRLESFVKEHSDHVLAATAQMSLYEIDLGSGKAKEVVSELEKKMTEEQTILPKDALLALLARAYEMSGDEAKAKDAYQRIINEYPDSPYTIDAQRKVARG